ncbi:MAG: hypothetical protein ACXWV4_02945 [Flavitalea sp.]
MEGVLKTRVVRGMVIALIIIIGILLAMGISSRASKVWMIFPMILVPAAGALGGFIFHRLEEMKERQRISERLAMILAFMIYCILIMCAFVLSITWLD